VTSPEQLKFAKELLTSSGVQEIFKILEDRIIESWKTTPNADFEVREQLYYMQTGLQNLKNELEAIAKSDEIKNYNLRLASNQKLR
jgi:hypothetical protein